jgi:glycosyltransferase involved in cell wall biosynthesis
MRRMRGLYRELSRSEPFGAIHHLNPVEAGVSLAFADLRVPVVLGPYVPDWASSGVGADREVSRAALRVKRLLRAAQQRRATTVLLSTPAAASKLERFAQPHVRVREVPPGIDAGEWVPGPLDSPGLDVLFLANLEVRKGIHVLLDAFAAVAQRVPGARLRVAGEGPEREVVMQRLATSPALEGVEVLGHVERREVMSTLHDCDVYCLPSFGEPFGMTALEAMACARPVVATNAGGLAHLVSEEGGRKVPPGDGRALADALSEVLADPALRRSMGAHNRRLVEERYSWARVVDRLEEAYAEAIAARRSRKS